MRYKYGNGVCFPSFKMLPVVLSMMHQSHDLGIILVAPWQMSPPLDLRPARDITVSSHSSWAGMEAPLNTRGAASRRSSLLWRHSLSRKGTVGMSVSLWRISGDHLRSMYMRPIGRSLWNTANGSTWTEHIWCAQPSLLKLRHAYVWPRIQTWYDHFT